MEQPREMNLFDLCAAFGRMIGRAVKGVFGTIGSWIRLSLRKWWIVLPIVGAMVSLALYYSREDNRAYKVTAVAIINGATRDVLYNEFTALDKSSYRFGHQNLATTLGIAPELAIDNYWFVTYNIVDFMADDVADVIDFKYELTYDSLTINMPDRLALQFRTKQPNNVPLLQEAILNYLNSRESILAPFAQYRANLEREAKFHHDQLEKLDSLTSVFYFSHNQEAQLGWNNTKSGLVLGGREVKLFLDEIQDEMKALQRTDARLAYASAPVVLQTPFVISPLPINGPIKCTAIAVILGWLLGLMIASLVEHRTEILPWIRKK